MESQQQMLERLHTKVENSSVVPRHHSLVSTLLHTAARIVKSVVIRYQEVRSAVAYE